MKVLLLTDVKALGKRGDIVEVNDGYAKNFLIAKKMAAAASKQVINEHAMKLEKEAREKEKERQDALELCRLLSTTTIKVPVKCGIGKMYGSVTTADIAAGLSALGFNVEKKNISIKEPMRKLGLFEVEVWCYKETVAKVKIDVVKAED